MKIPRTQNLFAAALVCGLALATTGAHAADPTTAFRGWPAPVVGRRQGLAVHPGLVARVTMSGADFEPAAKRIATFDNDGTLSSEQIVDLRIVGRL
jgi:hypothetical protein